MMIIVVSVRAVGWQRRANFFALFDNARISIGRNNKILGY